MDRDAAVFIKHPKSTPYVQTYNETRPRLFLFVFGSNCASCNPYGASRAWRFPYLQSVLFDGCSGGHCRIPIRSECIPLDFKVNTRITLSHRLRSRVLVNHLLEVFSMSSILNSGIWSGFIITTGSHAAPSATTTSSSGGIPGYKRQVSTPSFTITVNDTNPAFFYCAQIGHCKLGMVFALNPSVVPHLDSINVVN